MVTKYNIGDEIKTENFTGVISMITITKKGICYRAYGELVYPGKCILRHAQTNIMEEEIKNKI